jgi:asparagine synthase (glutamine-hydrolysing)
VTIVRNGPRAATLAEQRPGRPGVLADPHLVYLGELESQDGVDALPQLLLTLRRDHGLAARLTVIGPGSRRAALEHAVSEAGLDDAVRFTGRVPHAQVPALLSEADVCIDVAPCSELNHRSTMVKVGEYLAAGRAVVSYRLCETERTAGGAALYADCGELPQLAASVAAVAADASLRHELERRALERARELVWERSQDALLSAYASLPTNGSRRSGANR